MNRNTLAKALQGLIVLFIGVVALAAFFVIPNLYWFFMEWPDVEAIQVNMKVIFAIAEVLLAMFAVALVIIIDLLNMFSKDLTYTEPFTNKLRNLSVMCGISSVIISGVGLNILFRRANIPYSSGILAGILVVLALVMIVGVVIALIRTIVIEATEYKEENDLTV